MTKPEAEKKTRAPRAETKAQKPEPARAIVREAVEETLQRLGFDTAHPAELQADMLYLRKLRRGSEDMHRVVLKVVFSILLSGVLYALWQGIVERLKGMGL